MKTKWPSYAAFDPEYYHSEAVPPHRLGVVLGHTLAAGVHEPEVELRGGVALLGVVLESSKGGSIVASLICIYRCIEELRR